MFSKGPNLFSPQSSSICSHLVLQFWVSITNKSVNSFESHWIVYWIFRSFKLKYLFNGLQLSLILLNGFVELFIRFQSNLFLLVQLLIRQNSWTRRWCWHRSPHVSPGMWHPIFLALSSAFFGSSRSVLLLLCWWQGRKRIKVPIKKIGY